MTILGPAPPVAPDVMSREAQGGLTVRAVRVAGLRVDGQLDDSVYSSVLSISGFTQSVPDVGEPVSQDTEAWIFFDDDSLYIARAVLGYGAGIGMGRQ